MEHDQKYDQKHDNHEYKDSPYYEAIITKNYEYLKYLIQSNFNIEEGFIISLMAEDETALKLFKELNIYVDKAIDIITTQDALSQMILLSQVFEDDFNLIQTYQSAIKHDSLDIVSYILDSKLLGTEVVYESINNAAKNGKFGMLILLLSYGSADLGTFVLACWGGNIDIIRYLMPKEQPEENQYINRALMYIAGHGYIEIMDRLISLGATDLNAALTYAVIKKKITAARFLIRAGANNIDEMLIHAVRNHDYKMVVLLISTGVEVATVEAAMSEATHIKIYRLLYSVLHPYDMVPTTRRVFSKP